MLLVCFAFYLGSVFAQVLRLEQKLQKMVDEVEDYCLLHYPAEEKKGQKATDPSQKSEKSGSAAAAISSMMKQ